MIDTSSVHPPRIAVLFVLATVPLLFGAVHPIVQSGYVCLVLAGLGGWLLLRRAEQRPIAWATLRLTLVTSVSITSTSPGSTGRRHFTLSALRK